MGSLYSPWLEYEISPIDSSRLISGPQLVVMLGKVVELQEIRVAQRKWGLKVRPHFLFAMFHISAAMTSLSQKTVSPQSLSQNKPTSSCFYQRFCQSNEKPNTVLKNI